MTPLKQRIAALKEEFGQVKSDYALPNSTVDIGNMYYFAGNFEVVINELEAENTHCREALEMARTGFNDWIVSYAPDMCDEQSRQETGQRIGRIGTLGYIANIQREIMEALNPKEGGDV